MGKKKLDSNELASKYATTENVISDKIKAETHGFDKFSFRKRKSVAKK